MLKWVSFWPHKLTELFSFWPKKSSKWVRKIPGARNGQNGSVSGARIILRMSVFGPKNFQNESGKFLVQETDKMWQFLKPEIVYYGQVELYDHLLNLKLKNFICRRSKISTHVVTKFCLFGSYTDCTALKRYSTQKPKFIESYIFIF